MDHCLRRYFSRWMAVGRQIVDSNSPLAAAPFWVRAKAVAVDFYNDPVTYSLTLLQNDPGGTLFGLGLVASGRRVWAIDGGPQPGLTTSNLVDELSVMRPAGG